MLHCFIAFLPILFHLSQQNYRLSPRRNATAATDELPPPQSLLLRFLKRDARKLGTSAKRERSPSHLSSRALLARIEEERLGTRQTDENVNDSHTGWQKQWITLCTKKHFISQRRETVLFPLSNESPESEARDQYARWHKFWWKSWFLGREKNLWSQMDQSQPTYEPKVQWLLRQPMN